MTIWVSGEDLWNWRQGAEQVIKRSVLDAQVRHERLQELDWLLLAVTELDRLALRLESFRQRPRVALSRSLDNLSTLWQQHLQDNVPLQYLLGTTHWRDFTVQVGPGVLIPRPETELLIDFAQAAVGRLREHNSADLQWADLGTGSGVIALGLARSFPGATIHAVDCSTTALEIAQRNAAQLNLSDQIRFYQGSWLEPLGALHNQLDGIVSNPPYIPRGIIPTLQPEVANHEPHLALDGGKDGLNAIRTIVHQAPRYLRPDGVLLLEMMMGQAAAVANLFIQHGGYKDLQIHRDLAGIQRFTEAYQQDRISTACERCDRPD